MLLHRWMKKAEVLSRGAITFKVSSRVKLTRRSVAQAVG